MFEGFGIEYLFGATAFGIFNLASLFFMLIMLCFVWGIVIYFQKEGNVTVGDFKYTGIGLVVGLFLIAMLFPSMVIQPRVVISVPPNSALIEHQSQQGEIVIITPEPRIEYLDGFRPLGDQNN